MTEKDLQSCVERLARLLGWRTYHTRYSIQSAAGYPDLTLARPPRLVFIELKRDGKDPTPVQRTWLDDLANCGAEVHILRPADWHSGEIERVLR